jgi:hypothetical protein
MNFHLEAAKPNARKKNAIHATLALIGRGEQRPAGHNAPPLNGTVTK